MNYFVFTDEAGSYKQNPSAEHIRKHPYYIRSYVAMSIDDYRNYQREMLILGKEFAIPFKEEIKWSDLFCKIINKPRNSFIEGLSTDSLKGYYRKVLETATNHDSLNFIFTLTDIIDRYCNCREETLYSFHLQDAFQRIQMDLSINHGFAIFVMDELNSGVINQIKAVCHSFTENGDFVNYNNLYHGVLIENSLYSPGIQLADYAAGIMNGYLRGKTTSQGKFKFATDLFNEFVNLKLRKIDDGINVGYSIIDIPKKTPFRGVLVSLFDAKDD